MNEADRKMLTREQDANPERPTGGKEEVEEVQPIERTATESSSSTSISSRSRPQVQEIGMSRMPTRADSTFGIERSNTALSRIETGRSQHTATVGAGLRSRTMSSKLLPAFGAGKPYPPPLPEREEYVVEFDGPNDPMHAQNWPFRKK